MYSYVFLWDLLEYLVTGRLGTPTWAPMYSYGIHNLVGGHPFGNSFREGKNSIMLNHVWRNMLLLFKTRHCRCCGWSETMCGLVWRQDVAIAQKHCVSSQHDIVLVQEQDGVLVQWQNTVLIWTLTLLLFTNKIFCLFTDRALFSCEHKTLLLSSTIKTHVFYT